MFDELDDTYGIYDDYARESDEPETDPYFDAMTSWQGMDGWEPEFAIEPDPAYRAHAEMGIHPDEDCGRVGCCRDTPHFD
jgi:hypothetical protein